jgi:hypothetical protein
LPLRAHETDRAHLASPDQFAEVLGLYGLIVALILNTRGNEAPDVRFPSRLFILRG